MDRIDLVVFDMAGTTIKDEGQVVAAFMGTLQENRIPATAEELQQWRGASKREVLRAFIERQFGRDAPDNAARVERAYDDFRERLESHFLSHGVNPIPGVEATFAWLGEHGVKIALTTGFYRRVTDIIIHAVGWDAGMVDATVCSDEVPKGRPAPYMIFRAMEATGVTDVGRVIKVGDTALDLLAGTNAGLRGVVGVLTGSQGVEQLGRVPHTHIIPSAAELPAVLRSVSNDLNHQP